MNRVLATVLVVTAVVGATSGTVVARSVLDRSAEAGSSGRTTGDPRAEEVLWTTRDRLYDGDRVVRTRLPGAPVQLQRAVGGWVVSTVRDPGVLDLSLEPRQTSVVTPDGEVRPLAATLGGGDVSPDGTRYVARERDGEGYAVWDVASGERLATLTDGSTAGQPPAVGAQFVDLDSVGTTWARSDGAQDVVVADLGSDDPPTLVADDVSGAWAISPDGRWFAGSLPKVSDGERDLGCLVVRPVDGSSEGRTDCGGQYPWYPSFAGDSSAVLSVPPSQVMTAESYETYFFRRVPTGDRPVPPRIDAPNGSAYAVMLGRDRVVSLGSEPLESLSYVGEGLLEELGAEPPPEPVEEEETTVVQVCSAGAGCRVVQSVPGGFEQAALGTPY